MKYFYSLRFFILFSFLFFIFSVILGYFSAQSSPEEAGRFLEEMIKMYGPIIEMSAPWQFLFIFLNNSFTLFLVLILGIIFGIFPILVLFSNGAILGILGFFAKDTLLWSGFFLGILPHGIIEIPVMILASAVGLKIGKTVFQKVFKKDEKGIKKELSYALKFFFKILLPLLILAAAIEVFITTKLLGI